MNILYYTNKDSIDSEIIPNFLQSKGDKVFITFDEPKIDLIKLNHIDFILSDKGRKLIKEPVLSYLENKIVNMHASYLPFNRGYYPIFWSIFDETPCGNTIHYIDESIDTGDIIAQNMIEIKDDDTLRTTYFKLREKMIKLLIENWASIKNGACSRKKQTGAGTIHYKKEFSEWYEKLPMGWDTPVRIIKNIIRK